MGQLTKILKEIKTQPYRRVWDFSKYIPNFNPNNIRIKDILKIDIDNIHAEVNDITDGYLWYGPIENDDTQKQGWINKQHLKRLNDSHKNDS